MVEPSSNKRHSPDIMAINRSFMLFVQGKLIPNRQKQNHVKAQRKNVKQLRKQAKIITAGRYHFHSPLTPTNGVYNNRENYMIDYPGVLQR
jgi:Holliday junction resolvase